MIAAVDAATNASIARVFPRVAKANTANMNRNQKAETEGVRYRNTARTRKSTVSGIRMRASPRNRSASATTRANVR